MEGTHTLTERLAVPGAVVEVEAVYLVTPAGVEYLATHALADAPMEEPADVG